MAEYDYRASAQQIANERGWARVAARKDMLDVCVALLTELHATWDLARFRAAQAGGSAPARVPATVAVVRAYLAQARRVRGVDVPAAFGNETTAGQASMVRTALEAGFRAGKFERSVGPGARPGTEARAYELRVVE